MNALWSISCRMQRHSLDGNEKRGSVIEFISVKLLCDAGAGVRWLGLYLGESSLQKDNSYIHVDILVHVIRVVCYSDEIHTRQTLGFNCV